MEMEETVAFPHQLQAESVALEIPSEGIPHREQSSGNGFLGRGMRDMSGDLRKSGALLLDGRTVPTFFQQPPGGDPVANWKFAEDPPGTVKLWRYTAEHTSNRTHLDG
ncbi:hypothetical protein R1sor_018452 [Riccia sorocarpa]|uniref:Uncharacterized protein n=1 Tax=Riccia sorocarpa TaxID=122646 RepID=A0ABD3IDF2_9MARC